MSAKEFLTAEFKTGFFKSHEDDPTLMMSAKSSPTMQVKTLNYFGKLCCLHFKICQCNNTGLFGKNLIPEYTKLDRQVVCIANTSVVCK